MIFFISGPLQLQMTSDIDCVLFCTAASFSNYLLLILTSIRELDWILKGFVLSINVFHINKFTNDTVRLIVLYLFEYRVKPAMWQE